MTFDNRAEKIDEKARGMLADMLESKSTVAISRELGINRGLIPYVLEGGHSPTVLDALGLPIYERREVPVCLECGSVHTMHKTCSEERRHQERYRKCADLETRDQQEALEDIATRNNFDSWTELCRLMSKIHIEALESGNARMIVIDLGEKDVYD